MTWKEYAEMNGRTPESVRVQLFRLYRKLNLKAPPFNEHSEVDDERLNLLNSKNRSLRTPQPIPRPTRPPANSLMNQPAKPKEQRRKWNVNASDLLLVFIVVAEMLLALIGSYVQFSYGGLLIGSVLVAFYANTGWQMWKGDSTFAQDWGMFICAIITCVFMWASGQTFWLWYTGDPALKIWVSTVSAGLFSIVSYSSLWQLKNVRIK